MYLRNEWKKLEDNNTAILAVNFYNFETGLGSVRAAGALNMPLIMQATQSSIEYMGLTSTVCIARTLLQQHNVKGWLHLDHADSYELIEKCLKAGFDSVMIDASEKSVEENIDITRKVVHLAQKYNANVEAELGYVAKLGQSHRKSDGFTKPEEAERFVTSTGVDALAVAIGSAHGFYKEEPHLDIQRLKEIHEAVDAAIVLHGSSGIPSDQVQNGIRNGIRKINLATEVKHTFMKTLKKVLDDNTEIDLRKVFPSAINAITELVKHKMNVIKEV